jgi:hypothetical protein
MGTPPVGGTLTFSDYLFVLRRLNEPQNVQFPCLYGQRNCARSVALNVTALTHVFMLSCPSSILPVMVLSSTRRGGKPFLPE